MEVINKFANVEGIVAAAGGERGALVFAFSSYVSDEGRARWKDVFNNLVGVIDLVGDEDEIRLVLKEHTLLLRRGGDVYVAAVVTKGHPVVKSLQRMVRKSIKKLGGRVDPAGQIRPPRPAASVPSAPAPATETPSDGGGEFGQSI